MNKISFLLCVLAMAALAGCQTHQLPPISATCDPPDANAPQCSVFGHNKANYHD